VSPLAALTRAMAAERKQKKRMDARPRTQKKPNVPERPFISSSSTWKKEPLKRFKVYKAVADAKTIVPEKWFKFDNLERYQSGKYSGSLQPDW
jgi:hypothetical protein